ncbi:MAG TPA: serine/threonine-protein kinase [Polyangia bacterium]|nr:serine/threonine-protein kinase [Polyangia bacterium]
MSEASANPEHGTATLARGASIGRYVVLGLVGRGGMGEVYAAYDPELDRKVAVKLLRVKPGAGVSLTEGRQRTLREAQAIARLSHPNVVVVFDVGTFEEKVFIAMEFVEGHTAGFWTQQQARTWQETLKVYMAAGRGLAAAHDKGLVHRDFKPDNVMVSRDGQVRVMDFGLARQADRPVAANGGGGEKAVAVGDGVTTTQRLPAPLAEPAKGGTVVPLDSRTLVLTPVANDAGVTNDQEPSYSQIFDARLTRTGAMMGTPAYMAPEQFRGNPTDARTDQFAFCIALYESLYGERPFAGNTLMALTTNVVNGRIREPPANTKVPLWIRKILLRGLRTKADERYPSMAELLEALGKNPAVARKQAAIGITAGLVAVGLLMFGLRPGLADPKQVCAGGPEKLAGIWELTPPGAPESPRQARLHQAFLASGKSYAKDVWATTSRSLTTYARAWTDMYRENCEATSVRKEQGEDVRELRAECLTERLGGLHALTDVFSEADGEVVENAVSASNSLASLDRCANVPLLRAVVRPPEDATTKQKVDDLRKRVANLKARYDAGQWKETRQKAPSLVAEARKIGYQPLLAEALLLSGHVMIAAGDSGLAAQTFDDAFLTAEASRHDEVRAEAAVLLVFVVGYQQSRFQEGRRWAKVADAILQRLGGHELLQAWLLNDLGVVLVQEGSAEAAMPLFERSLALKERALGPRHPDVGVAEVGLAFALNNLGRNEEALSHSKRAAAILEEGLGAAHPDLALCLSNSGEMLNALGRYDEARKSFARAYGIWEGELGSDNVNLGFALTGIGVGYIAEGKSSEAVAPLERAYRLREQHEPESSRFAETSFALARALWESTHDRARARGLAERARDGYAKLSEKKRLAEVNDWLRDHGAG